jgi:hypothetical protein
MADTYDNPDMVNVKNPLEAMQPGEQVICEIKRHPIGMLSKYFTVGFILFVFGAFAIFVIPVAVPQASQTQAREFALLGLLLVAVVSALALMVASTVYYKNRWIVTSDSITQVAQTSLFSSQLSQLSMANLQDVTVAQDGILCSMFNFGVLKAETAGERSKFVFAYCPDPKRYAQKILMTRENFINASPETAKRGNVELAVPHSQMPTNGLGS